MEALPSTVVAIVGINSDEKGCKCSIHDHCGSIVAIDMVVRLKMVHYKESKFELYCR